MNFSTWCYGEARQGIGFYNKTVIFTYQKQNCTATGNTTLAQIFSIWFFYGGFSSDIFRKVGGCFPHLLLKNELSKELCDKFNSFEEEIPKTKTKQSLKSKAYVLQLKVKRLIHSFI